MKEKQAYIVIGILGMVVVLLAGLLLFSTQKQLAEQGAQVPEKQSSEEQPEIQANESIDLLITGTPEENVTAPELPGV